MRTLRSVSALLVVVVAVSAAAALGAPASAPGPAAQSSPAAALSPAQPQASLPAWSPTILQGLSAREAALGVPAPIEATTSCPPACPLYCQLSGGCAQCTVVGSCIRCVCKN